MILYCTVVPHFGAPLNHYVSNEPIMRPPGNTLWDFNMHSLQTIATEIPIVHYLNNELLARRLSH